MAYHLLTSALRGTSRSAAPRLFGISRLFPRQVTHVGVKGLTPSTATIDHSGVCTTSFATRRLSDIAAPIQPDIRTQLEGHIDELFKNNQISPAFLSPALPPTPAKDLSEASEFMQQLTQNNAAIIRQPPAQHPLISVTHEELIQPILDSAETDPDFRKPVAFVTRGTGTGKTRALVESQLALMQHKDKNILPIAITFNNHTAIDKAFEGLNLHANPHMAYAIMVCSRVLAAFYRQKKSWGVGQQLAAIVSNLTLEPMITHTEVAQDLFQATLAHTVRRMRQARPEQPIDTVVLMVDETYMAHEAVGGAATTIDFSSNLRQALLDEKLLPDEEHVDVALCVSSLVPLDVKTESNRQVLSLPVASRVSTRDVVEKWWLPALMGKQGDAVKTWMASPENALHLKRLELLAATMAPIPRHLEFALRSLRKLFQQNGGKFDTEVDSFRHVMRNVIDKVKDKYTSTNLPLDVLRAALERKTLGSSPEATYQLSLVTLAKCIRKSMIVNTDALLTEAPFVPDVSLFIAAYCMRERKLEAAAPGAGEALAQLGEALAQLGEDFLNLPLSQGGDALEHSTAWMLHLRLRLLCTKYAPITTLKQIFGQTELTGALPDIRVSLKTLTVKSDDEHTDDEFDEELDEDFDDEPGEELDDGFDGKLDEDFDEGFDEEFHNETEEMPPLPHSQDRRSDFFDVLNRTFLSPGESKFWPKVDPDERFDHLLVLDMVEDEAGHSQADATATPFLIFIEDKSIHPDKSDRTKEPKPVQGSYVAGRLLKEAKKQAAPAKGSLLEAFVQGRFCFVYHYAAKIIPNKRFAKVHYLDMKASRQFLGPIAPIYTAMRAADKVAKKVKGTS